MSWLDGITNSVGHEFEQTPGDSEGQRSLACCSPQGCRVRHNLATEQQQRCLLASVSSNNQRATWWQLSSGPWIITLAFSNSRQLVAFFFNKIILKIKLQCLRAFLIAQLVKSLTAVQETLVRFLGWEDPLKKEQATHSSIFGLPLWRSW